MAAAEDDEWSPHGADARTLALSDGVFAIALTLLVLSFHVPVLAPGHEHELGAKLLAQHDALFSWVLSFVVLAATWARHRALFTTIREVDGRLTALNLAYLGFAAFLPYPTDVLGRYGSQPAAVALYTVTLALLAAAGGLMVRHAERAELLTGAPRVAPERWWLVPVLLLLAIPLSPWLGAYSLLALFGLPIARRLSRPGR